MEYLKRTTLIIILLILFVLSLHVNAQETTGEKTTSEATLNRLFQEGAQSYQLADYRTALEKWQAALEQARILDNKQYSSQLLMNIGVLQWRLGQYEPALASLEQAAEVFRELGNRQGEAMIQNNIGMVYQNLGRYEEALKSYEQSLFIKRMFQDRRGEGNALGNIGNLYVYLGRYEEALESFEQTLAIARELGDGQVENVALSGIGWVYWNQGRYRQALKFYEQAMEVARKLGDRNGVGIALTGISITYTELGQYEQALEYHGYTLTLKQESGDRQGEGTTLNNIGVVYQNLRQYESALTYYNQALAIKRDIGDRQGEGQTLLNIGTVYDDLGQYEQALKYYKQALTIFQELGERQGEGNTLNNIGTVYSNLEQYEQALKNYEQSLAIRRDIGDRRGEITNLNNIGLIYKKREQYEQAAQALRKSLKICREVGAPQSLWMAQGGLAAVEGQLGKHAAAVALYEQALETIETMRTGLSQGEYRTSFMENKLFVYDELITLFYILHNMYPDKGYDRKALEIFERRQGRVFLEEMAKSGARFFAGVPEDILHHEHELESQLEQIRQQADEEYAKVKGKPNNERLEKLVQQAKILTAEEKALQAKIEKDYPDYHALKNPKPASLSELQQRVLHSDEMLLIYNVMEKNTAIWVISPTTMQMYTLPVGEKVLQEKIANVRQTMMHDWGTTRGLALSGKTDPQPSQTEEVSFPQVSHELYTLLIPEAVRSLLTSAPVPLLEGEGGKTLNIVPTGPLYNLPFELLLTRPAKDVQDAHYLIEDIPISYLSSASLLKILREAQARRTSTAQYPLLAFAHPAYTGESSQKDGSIRNLRGQSYRNFLGGAFEELPETADEARKIARVLNAPQESQPLQLSENASRKKVFEFDRNKRLDDYQYILFAMHGILPGEVDQVTQSALVLSDDFLTMADVLGLRLNARLVSLSACNTGRGKQIRGEGVRGLTRAFMYAGTPTVAVTLWSVESLSAKELDIGFFQYLHEGMPPARALQTIKTDMLQGEYGEDYRYPYYWAPFVVFGDGRS